jgi:flagellar motor switch protein FliM
MDQPARSLSPPDALHQAFATACAQSLTRQLGTIFRATPLPWTQLPYRDFVLTLADPTFLLVFTSNLFQGELTLEVHPSLAYLILERLLGGSDAEPFIPTRKFTEIESRLLGPILNELLEDLSTSWPAARAQAQPPTFTLRSLEHDPHSTHIVPDPEEVTALPIEFSLSHPGARTQNAAMRLTLCLPVPALATLGDDANACVDSYRCGFDTDNAIEFRAILAETSISEDELPSLQVGDILTTDTAADSEIILLPSDPNAAFRVGPARKLAHGAALHGRLVQLRGRKAIRITRFQ